MSKTIYINKFCGRLMKEKFVQILIIFKRLYNGQKTLYEIQIISVLQTCIIDLLINLINLKLLLIKNLNKVEDGVYKFSILTNDLLQRINLDRDRPPIKLQQLKYTLINLDESLKLEQRTQSSKLILDRKVTISMNDILILFNIIDQIYII
ncbi:unnamed protein product [Paramecium sonneborni]|uniref:Uncharacterized protein n=1 Tax=Paramecium sonneborni TaxID=65129 RepID=A0A8S1PP21_9CILI|nr:unnamed protein product [Paramecium sonneborni]